MTNHLGEIQPLDISDAQKQFEEANSVAAEITDQNSRVGRIVEIEDPELQAVASEWLGIEQRETLTRLELTARTAPYRELAQRFEVISSEIGALLLLKQEIESVIQAIDRQAEQAIAIAPLGRDRILTIAQQRKETAIQSFDFSQ